jgi:hypothetical protein
VIRIGSWKSCSVKALLWFQPFTDFAQYLPTKSAGRWQSTHAATVWCPAFCQESYWLCMMWQLAQAAGSALR